MGFRFEAGTVLISRPFLALKICDKIGLKSNQDRGTQCRKRILSEKEGLMGKMDKPSKKMSQIFMDFLKPVIPEVDENTTEHQIRSFFEIGLMVWNAVLLDSADPDNHYMDWIKDLLSKEPGYEGFILPLN